MNRPERDAAPPRQGAREWILRQLREGLADPSAAFKEPLASASSGAPPTPLTHATGSAAVLAERFGVSLDAAAGSHEMVEGVEAVAERVARRIEELWRAESSEALSFARALAWSTESLGVPGLAERLARDGVELIVPGDLHDPDQRALAAGVAVGITSADAAFASTGTLVLGADRGRSRSASLLPLHHIVLLPMSRVCPTPEAWFTSLRHDGRSSEILRDAAQVVFVTGPSKSADIELTLTLGVHGPRSVHAILFPDMKAGGP